MRLLASDSFDRYGRYTHVWEVRRASFGPDPIRVLDVGDPYGTLSRVLLDDHTVSIDLYIESRPDIGGHTQVIGSGFHLPFPDDSFDLVASHDTYEHLDDVMRPAFVRELLRVSRGPVVLVAPFADPRTTHCEEFINAYYVARVGHSLPPLDEHAACGLPSLDGLLAWLDGESIPYAAHGDGWLFHWLAFMLLKGHFVSEGAHDLDHRVDTAFNAYLREADARPPHYRRSVVMRPTAEYPLPPCQPSDGDVEADIARLTEMGIDITRALPRGHDPVAAGSDLRSWIESARGGIGPITDAARSVETAIDAVQRSLTVTLPPDAPQELLTTRTVAVVIINLNGAEHLPACLDSLAAQDYPRELTQVIVVDNASTDGSRELLAERYPWVRVLPQESNLGFAPAVNVGVRAAERVECVAFLNNDMRVDPAWLTELVRAYDPDDGVVCVGGQILSWDGERLDFGEGVVNFYGMGNQLGFGRSLGSVDVRDRQELLFACGGAMLVKRDVYLDAGGFDDRFFAYFEDVDFGWRLWVLGFRVRLAATAKAYHRMHGTSSRFPEHQRMLLYERNALRCIIKNYDDPGLAQVLGPSLLLLVKRAMLRGGLDRTPYEIGGDIEPEETVSRVALAHLHAVVDVVDGFDELWHARQVIQQARRRGDEEIVQKFGRPLQPVELHPDFVDAQQRVVRAFGLDRVFDRQRATRMLVVSSDEIGEKMRGPAIRAWEIARALNRTVDVTVAAPGDNAADTSGVRVANYTDEQSLLHLAETADVLLIQGYTLRRYPGLARMPGVMIVDLYDPWLFENLELHDDDAAGARGLMQDVSVLNELLDNGDFFICASERQRDYWMGMLSARGAINPSTYADDPSLRQLIDVVPFGLPDHPPRHERPVLKGVHPAVGEDDLVVLWGGGTWDWFDPLTVIEAFNIVITHIPNAKLYFLGLQLASPDVVPMQMAAAAVSRAEELGLAGTSVIFGDWAPYNLREAYLLEADVAVSAARDLAETRLAFRSRILDYLWAGLPVVTTSGDVLSDLVHEERLGIVVPPGDVGLLAHALVQLLGDPVRRAGCSDRARRVSERFAWTSTVEPLRAVVLQPWRWRVLRQRRAHGRAVTEDVLLLLDERGQAVDRATRELAEARERRDTDVAALQRHIDGLEELVAIQEQSLSRIRRLPVYPLVRMAKRLLRPFRRRG